MATADKGHTTAELKPPPASLTSAKILRVPGELSQQHLHCRQENHSFCKLRYAGVAYASTGNTTNTSGLLHRHHKELH